MDDLILKIVLMMLPAATEGKNYLIHHFQENNKRGDYIFYQTMLSGSIKVRKTLTQRYNYNKLDKYIPIKLET